MNHEQPSAPVRLAMGAAAGLVAGLIASYAMDRFQALVQPSSDQQGEPATQQVADRIVGEVSGEPLASAAKPAGGQAVHYGLGAALGVAYGVAAEFVPAVTAGAGTAFAGATWALLDEATVPAVGLGDPPWRSPAKTQAYGLISHLVFGLVAELSRTLAHAAIKPVARSDTRTPASAR